jgi:hypothetical protein
LGPFYLDSSRDNIIIVVGSKLRCIPPISSWLVVCLGLLRGKEYFRLKKNLN